MKFNGIVCRAAPVRPRPGTCIASLLALSAIAAAPAATQTFERFDEVEALPNGPNGPWEKCFVSVAYQGAYDLDCNHTDYLVYDTWVRKPGEAAPEQSAAIIGTRAPYPMGAIVLASPSYLMSSWELCIVQKPIPNDAYELMCGGETGYVVSAKWIRRDPQAPQVAQ